MLKLLENQNDILTQHTLEYLVIHSVKCKPALFFKDFLADSKDFPSKTFHRFFMQKISVLKTYLQKWHYQISLENVSAFPQAHKVSIFFSFPLVLPLYLWYILSFYLINQVPCFQYWPAFQKPQRDFILTTYSNLHHARRKRNFYTTSLDLPKQHLISIRKLLHFK